MGKSVLIFLTKCKKCFTFFDKKRKMFFFPTNAKSVSFFSTKCKKCFNVFDKMQEVFNFFRQDAKNVLLSSTKCKKFLSLLTRCNEQSGISYLGTSFLLFFALLSLQKIIKVLNMCASSEW